MVQVSKLLIENLDSWDYAKKKDPPGCMGAVWEDVNKATLAVVKGGHSPLRRRGYSVERHDRKESGLPCKIELQNSQVAAMALR